ncbi:S1C family serine protease [Cytobacillus dafuensis]|nr:trypsin-like peptidase domain-containing protein [Cytobacillus dafuensis]
MREDRPLNDVGPLNEESSLNDEGPLNEQNQPNDEGKFNEQNQFDEESSLNVESSVIEENPINEQFQKTEQSRLETKQVKNSKYKSLLMTVSAGVIGSVLTLTAVTYLPNFNNDAPQEEVSQAASANPSSGSLEVNNVSTNSLADMIEQASKAIVGITNIQQQNNPFLNQGGGEVESGSGSGVIFKKSGNTAYIVTNNHVIENANKIEVTLENGDKTKAELIGTDALTDIAVLKISDAKDAAVLDFGDSSKVRAGDQVLAIGNPLGLDLSRTVTQGIVSAVNRSVEVSTSAGNWDVEVIQTDAAINPGNSGGALINTSGQMIGINSMKIAENGVEGLGFAIPSNEVKNIINEIMDNGQVVRPYLGVSLADLNEIPRFYFPDLPNSVTKGAVVTTVDPDAAGAKAGLQVQDVIVSIGGKEINDSNDLRKNLYNHSIGDKVEVKFYRDGKLKSVKVTLSSKQLSY